MSFVESVRDAGVIGAGGAGFPTHAKLTSQAEYILMNGAECEPLLRVDQQLFAIYPDEIIKGFEAAGHAVGAKQAIIGIKGKHHEVIAIVREHIEKLGLGDYVSVHELPDIYPAGDEQVLVYEITGRVVPEASIPIKAGCVVVNTETCLNMYNAMNGRPVTEKYLTLAGDIPNRMTIKVPVGTPVREVLALSGVENLDDYAVIGGGPMMGPVLASIDGFITKKDKGFILLKKSHFLIGRKSTTPEQAKRVNRSACEQCRMCTDMCPRFLLGHGTEPHKMMRAMNYKLDNLSEQTIGQLCCQCNLCELFSCPAGLHPRFANMYFKDLTLKAGIRYQPKKDTFEPRDARKFRLVPSKRLIARLGLTDFDRPAPMCDTTVVPEFVHIARSQHVGAPAAAIVSVGDHVEAGQMIGVIPEKSLGAPIHASVSGMVTECGNDYIVIKAD